MFNGSAKSCWKVWHRAPVIRIGESPNEQTAGSLRNRSSGTDPVGYRASVSGGFGGSGGQSAQIFADGEVAVGAIYENRIREAKAVNPALAWTLNQAVVEKVHFVIPKSSQRIEEATLFINSTLRQENQAAFVRVNQYGASNPLAYDLLTADERAANIGAPENLAVELLYDGAFWAEAYPRYADAWEALKAGS